MFLLSIILFVRLKSNICGGKWEINWIHICWKLLLHISRWRKRIVGLKEEWKEPARVRACSDITIILPTKKSASSFMSSIFWEEKPFKCFYSSELFWSFLTIRGVALDSELSAFSLNSILILPRDGSGCFYPPEFNFISSCAVS